MLTIPHETRAPPLPEFSQGVATLSKIRAAPAGCRDCQAIPRRAARALEQQQLQYDKRSLAALYQDVSHGSSSSRASTRFPGARAAATPEESCSPRKKCLYCTAPSTSSAAIPPSGSNSEPKNAWSATIRVACRRGLTHSAVALTAWTTRPRETTTHFRRDRRS